MASEEGEEEEEDTVFYCIHKYSIHVGGHRY